MNAALLDLLDLVVGVEGCISWLWYIGGNISAIDFREISGAFLFSMNRQHQSDSSYKFRT